MVILAMVGPPANPDGGGSGGGVRSGRHDSGRPATPPDRGPRVAAGLPPGGGRLAALQPRTLLRRVARERLRRREEGPLRRAWRVVWLAYYHFEKDNAWVLAGHIAYMGLFATFPFLIFLLALAGAVGQGDAARQSVELALTLLPPDVAGALLPAIDEVRNAPHAGIMTASFVVTVWTSSSGIETLRHALNLAYDVADPPSFWRSRLESIGLTFLAALVLIVVTFLLVVLPLSLDVAGWFLQQPVQAERFYDTARYLLGTGLLLILLMGLYRILPNTRLRPLEIIPGALVAWGLWMVLHELYTLYLRSVPSYSVTYGSLGGIIVTLFFFYISALLFIFGAEINSVVKRWRDNREAGRRRRREAAGPGAGAG